MFYNLKNLRVIPFKKLIKVKVTLKFSEIKLNKFSNYAELGVFFILMSNLIYFSTNFYD